MSDLTRAEAIKKLEWALKNNTIYDENEALEYILAVKKGIEALEQEPCEDAIRRQAVLDGLTSIAKAKAKSDAQKSLMGRVMFFTEHLPSVTPKPKTDVLDKIRAEIEEVQTYKMFEGEDTVYVERNDVFKIIGKYKAEKE